MNPDPKNPRLARLHSEIKAHAALAVLLAAACSALALWTLLQVLPANPAPAQNEDQTLQEAGPAA